MFSSCKTLDNTNSSSSNTTYETLDVAISLPYSMQSLEDGDYFKEQLEKAGYTAVNFPLITGQDCDISSIKNIREGTQSMSVFSEVKTMSSKTMEIINTYLLFGKLPYNAVTRNGENSIPTYLCDSIYVDKNNWKEKLVDTGYYSIDVLQ